MISEFCKIACVSEEDLLGTSRKWDLSEMRHLYWKLLSENGFTRAQIGKLNDRHHSTITAGIIHINRVIETDSSIAVMWDKVKLIKR